jgi:hypothetical protein
MLDSHYPASPPISAPAKKPGTDPRSYRPVDLSTLPPAVVANSRSARWQDFDLSYLYTPLGPSLSLKEAISRLEIMEQAELTAAFILFMEKCDEKEKVEKALASASDPVA